MKLRHALAGTVALPLALAVAGTTQASVTVFENDTTKISNYGRLQVNVENWDGDSRFTDGNGTSRFGFHGTSDLGNGMTAFANYEMRFTAFERNDDNDKAIRENRETYVGLQGDFGQVRLGNFNSVVYTNVTAVGDLAKGQGTALGFVSGADNNAWGRQVAYQTNDLHGLTAGFAVQHTAENDAGQDEEFNVQAWAKYQIDPTMSLAIGFDQNNEDGAGVAWGGEPIVSANFLFTGIENTVLGVIFETTEVGFPGYDSEERLIHLGVAGVHSIGNSNVYGVISYLDWDTGEENSLQAMVGADHHMSDNFLVFGEASFATEEFNTMVGGDDDAVFAVGARFHW